MLNLSVYGGAGEAADGANVDVMSTAGEFYSGFQANGSYTNRKTRPGRGDEGGDSTSRAFTAGGGATVRYVPATNQYMFIDRSARVGYESQIGRRTRLSVNESLQATPFYRFGPSLIPPDADAAAPPVIVDGSPTVGRTFYDLGTAVNVSRNFSRDTVLAMTYDSHLTMYSSAMDASLMTHRAGVGMRYGLSKHAAFVLGTAFRFGQSQQDGIVRPTKAQDIDLGVDYNRALSFARNTTLSFTTGTTIVSQSGNAPELGSIPGRRLHFIGTVALARSLGRNWEVRGGYRRNVQFVAGYPDPFYISGTTARLTGLIGRRVTVFANADHSGGNAIRSGVELEEMNVRELRSQTRLSVALSSRFQLFAEHTYTSNSMSAAAQASLADGLLTRPHGQAIRVGVDLWASHVH